MEKLFIPYEPALALRELGFNEECFGTWWFRPDIHKEGEEELIYKFTKYFELPEYEILAPTWGQTFDWFEENYGLFVSFDKIDNSKNFYYDFMVVDSKDRDYNDEDLFDSASRKLDKGKYETKEEARLEALKKLVELCEKN